MTAKTCLKPGVAFGNIPKFQPVTWLTPEQNMFADEKLN